MEQQKNGKYRVFNVECRMLGTGYYRENESSGKLRESKIERSDTNKQL